MYRPLPPEVTIRNSCIDGLGLFTTCDIEAGHNLGITHVANDNFENQYIRTPLGGFINHSTKPNCVKVKPRLRGFPKHWPIFKEGEESSSMAIRTSRDIKEDEELTVFYTLYKIDQ